MNNQDNEKVFQKSNINWYPGHMAKARRIIQEKYSMIDIVYEVVDARIPFSSKMKDIYDLIGKKRKILVMTKKDLCDEQITSSWVKYYENLGTPTLLLNLNNPHEVQKLVDLTHELTKDIQEKRNQKGLNKKEIRALVVGIPNVGKSTLINRMCGKNIAKAENHPGVTQNVTWLKTNSDIILLDTPGLLWPKLSSEEEALNLSACSAIKESILPINQVAVHILKKLSSYYPTILKEVYGVDRVIDENIENVYEIIAKRYGLLQHGEVNYEGVSTKIVRDIITEKIKGITLDRK
ncbi:MAG: ribosome biogenesis GTPase YlqF [Bacilli bacterium]|nr:ribosome biogenesis GTPase YlqF [Bacilli bacterium]